MRQLHAVAANRHGWDHGALHDWLAAQGVTSLTQLTARDLVDLAIILESWRNE